MKALRVLLIENDPRDADRVRETLAAEFPGSEFLCVEESAAATAQLSRGHWDVVLSNPEVLGPAAFAAHVPHLSTETPFICIARAQSENQAVECLRRGATDYVLKDRLARLPHAVQRAVTNAEFRSTHQRMNSMLETTTDFIALLDPSLRLTYVNRGGRQLLGLPLQSKPPASSIDRFQPKWAARLLREQGLPCALREGRWLAESALLNAAGHEIPVSQLLIAHRTERGDTSYLSTTMRDISERKAHEHALRQSEQMLRTLLDFAPEAIVIWDIEAGVFSDANAKAATLFGLPLAELLRVGPVFVSPPEQACGTPSEQLAQAKLKLVLEHGSAVFDWLHRHVSGEIIPCEVHLVRLPGRGTLIRGSVIDARHKKELEAQLRHAQKMEALGRLAGGVAHDFNNLLTVIAVNTELLLKDNDLLPTQRNSIEQIASSSNRAAGLTRQLLAFSRKKPLRTRVVDLNLVVSEMEKLLVRLLGEQVHLQTRLCTDLWHIRADLSQVEQVIINLAVNARDAMPHGGTLSIETTNEEHGAANEPGQYVKLTVVDTGTGIDKSVLNRIFEPFFTTKSAELGTGLGLSLVYGIVQQSGGHVSVDSEVGRGSRFLVFFPRVFEALVEEPAPHVVAARSAAAETLMIVEDDDLVRATLRIVLKQAGYRLLEASSARDALEKSTAFVEHIHLLIADMVMPDMSGLELAERIRNQHVETKVLFISGYPALHGPASGNRSPAPPLLQKPFLADELLAAVRKLLD